MTTMERQKTFRKNAKLWLDSAPEGRLLMLKQVHHIQQSSQTKTTFAMWCDMGGQSIEEGGIWKRFCGFQVLVVA